MSMKIMLIIIQKSRKKSCNHVFNISSFPHYAPPEDLSKKKKSLPDLLTEPVEEIDPSEICPVVNFLKQKTNGSV